MMPAKFSKYDMIEAAGRELMFASILRPELQKEAVKVYVDYIHSVTEPTFSGAVKKLSTTALVSKKFVDAVSEGNYDDMIVHERDYEMDYMGILSMKKNYMLCIDDKIFERPQYTYMRVAVQVGESAEEIKMLYDMLSTKKISFATPIIANSGTNVQNMNSCFLVAMEEDSIGGIYTTLNDIAKLCQKGGGIGVHIHNIRSVYSKISTTGKNAGGIIPMLRVYDSSSAYVDQGGRRPGAIAVYVEMHNPEVLDFLSARKTNSQSDRAIKNLFPAIWMSDLFMKRVEQDGTWSFFDSKTCPQLNELFGLDYEKEYVKLETEKKFVFQKPAKDVMGEILHAEISVGLPYIVSKDRVNRCSNQINLGTIKSSNLCTEIVQYSAPGEISCCTLASIVLSSFVVNGQIDFDGIDRATRTLVRSLDHIIDLNDYSIIDGQKTEISSRRHRPIAIGVVGLADMLLKMRVVYGSKRSLDIVERIAEQMYYSAISASCDLAAEKQSYITFYDSPLANGQFHFDLWKKSMKEDFGRDAIVNLTLDWESLRARAKRGVRNSLLIGHMPTGTTSQILGVHECFEPYTSNIYTRRIGAGDLLMINKFLVDDLIALGVWNDTTYRKIVAAKGSIQSFEYFEREDGTRIPIPVILKSLYRTVYEVGPKRCIDVLAKMVPFTDQSSSKNVYYSKISKKKMAAVLFYSWKMGLKTLQYYARTEGAAEPLKVTCTSCST